jgi:hypothetical protein
MELFAVIHLRGDPPGGSNGCLVPICLEMPIHTTKDPDQAMSKPFDAPSDLQSVSGSHLRTFPVCTGPATRLSPIRESTANSVVLHRRGLS